MTDVFGVSQKDTSPTSGQAAHEQVVFCSDERSGLRAIIAIYNTALGPSLGGTRFYPYESEQAALADVLNLSRAMAYKAALAGLDLGGGKAVIIGDPSRDKSEALLRAYGRFIETLNGRYITACDVGTYSEDMDVIARESPHVTGRTLAYGGAGDSSILTAFGVFQGMRAAAQHKFGTPSLSGRRVGVEGVGKVGHRLVDHLVEEGAEVSICEPRKDAVQRVLARHPHVKVLADQSAMIDADLDIYAPCALGGSLNDDTVPRLRAGIVCGGANNQLAHLGVEKQLAERGILYAPDYLVNSGGVIQVADEIGGFDMTRARAKASQIFDTTLKIFAIAAEEGVPPAVAADRLAERRMSEVGRIRAIWLGH
ncbi:Glu/Leu/Phe/Val dehydrogenase dimerization domain-containing protein [Spongiactinospora sp. TRM90649]|uniref:Leu/Phe/Val dehydrogenase n=1 Tax=Spongiactinospora sp. TRM90649 TaxID=3031114 RepID=UPI0023F9C75D|nr:Glu/Leu/Phe/Val dehydrogenase dimerization domain-containing protein [Spongiactinospora sp. TRM90649]MDF5754468.1 Glu/Leu/Phe/Val dehydrogenase dimerization domain-containing protein [Spongiactinospora sp. TRM90649]